ncbi:hypothetical protein [Oleiharenicola lentus]|uniref:hypothetical protein n=1 Tax=Oleiharenicola lentus TaxID=2508720 RepID=UPI003F662859
MSSIPFAGKTLSVSAATLPPADAFRAQLSALYALSQKNHYIFGSPLGPFFHQTRHAYVPRFVFFGPHASDDSWRLAFLAGYDRRDLRASRAMLHLVERLANHAEQGHGLNLSFFPLVDAGGFFLDVPPRALAEQHWGRTRQPEIDLLEKDARLRGYHGFIRIESAAPGDDIITIRVRQPRTLLATPDLELISSEETTPFPVRFECDSSEPATAGPLSVADDLPHVPFELVLQVPASWPDDIYHEAVSYILTRFILRYRAFQAYGQHL